MANIDPTGQCQRYSVCWLRSPGPVLDSETLARWVYTPPHVAKPLPGALSDSFFEDIVSNGFSSQRFFCKWARSRVDVHERGEKSVEKDAQRAEAAVKRDVRKYLGVIHFDVSDLRDLEVKVDVRNMVGTSCLRIYDTALPGNRMHAEVMAFSEGQTDKARKAAVQQMRVRLMNLAHKSGLYKAPKLSDDDDDLRALGLAVHAH